MKRKRAPEDVAEEWLCWCQYPNRSPPLLSSHHGACSATRSIYLCCCSETSMSGACVVVDAMTSSKRGGEYPCSSSRWSQMHITAYRTCSRAPLKIKIPKSRSEEHPLTTVAGKLHQNSIDMAKMARRALASTFLLLLVPASAADASQHVMSAHSRSAGGTMSDVRDEYV